jgi:hypothetical protein
VWPPFASFLPGCASALPAKKKKKRTRSSRLFFILLIVICVCDLPDPNNDAGNNKQHPKTDTKKYKDSFPHLPFDYLSKPRNKERQQRWYTMLLIAGNSV